MLNKAENTQTKPSTILDYWNEALEKHPEKDAVRDSHGKIFSYEEADRMASSIARYLHDCGIQKGDIVAVQMPGWAEFVPIYMACMKLGAAITPIPANLRLHELTHMVERCGSKALFVPRSYRNYTYCEMAGDLCKTQDALRVVIAVDKFNEGSILPTLRQIVAENADNPWTPEENDKPGPDDLAVIIFTSGSEGEAKGVMLTHKNVLAAERAFSSFFNITNKDKMFMAAPPAHAIGFHHGITMPIMVGATIILQDRFLAEEAVNLIELHRATVTMAPTPFLHDLVEQLHKKKADISSLRFFLCGGAPPNLSLVQEAGDLGIKVLNVYGATESVPHMGTRPDATEEQIKSQVLFPMPGITVRIVDNKGNEVPDGTEGEQISFSDAVFQGYLGMDDATKKALKDGWYHSGDLCKKNPDGSYVITGRLKHIIIRGGENISCLEVENILLCHDNIGQVAVVGMPDERLQERVCAYVVLKDPSIPLTLDDITEHFKARNVAKMKYPERLEILSEMPQTHSGKIDKNVLTKDIKEKLKAGL